MEINENFIQFTISFGSGTDKLSISGLPNNKVRLSKNNQHMYITQTQLWDVLWLQTSDSC